ncbi:SIP domain-containing protein [Leucobacter allii]|uniref:SIP domain-containing protein n=1 Tax=Leucobacter allii TaxID=2932247 RepID=A0ABY4FRD3_9MICO|nr:SIP domain-containing protein [Leucobacter allii]UOQ58830.1 SIP domain-containing protein [Leucobacter allii]UOR03464.1 SIP domain-containing protein [Leucobacter allii]
MPEPFDDAQIVSVVDPDGIDCVLAAGDVSDLPELRGWLAGLPETAYGRVFIEVFAEMQIEPLPVPPHVGVTWLCREQREASPRPGVGRRRGEALAGAVEAWFQEWLWADSEAVRNIQLWMGARTSSVMQSYWAQLDRRLERRWPGFCQQECRGDRAGER